MPNWFTELAALFKEQIGHGELAGAAYDTAWLASVPDPEHPERPAFPQALEWLRLHQHSDGSWGAEAEYYHDRVLSTLIAAIVLARWHPDEWTEYQISAGIRAIWRHMALLSRDPSETVGFELILPTLLTEAKALGFDLPYASFSVYEEERRVKLDLIPRQLLYSRYSTSTFSLEFLGDSVDPTKLDGDLQEADGSIASSPAATSYFYRHTGDARARDFLRAVAGQDKGSAPTLVHADILEMAWCLYNLYLVEETWPDAGNGCVDALWKMWSERGVSLGRHFTPADLDDTALTFLALFKCGKPVSPDVFLQYEVDDHFRCLPYERDASPSVHIHVVEALRACAPFPGYDRMTGKALQFLEHTLRSGIFWFDKWHASPYYTTGHGIIALLTVAPHLVRHAINWMVQTQRPDGTWGYLAGTTEETAYGLQALAYSVRHGVRVPREALDKAAAYLADSIERKHKHYRALWIGKTLYAPTWIVHSAVLSALAMYERL
jgi:halimadienyl-diphosphate synthase